MMTERSGILATPPPPPKKRITPRTVSLPVGPYDDEDGGKTTMDSPPFSTSKMRDATWKRKALRTPQNSFNEPNGGGGDLFRNDNPTRVQRCLMGVTIAAFFLAALLGLSTNLHNIKNSSLQDYVLPTSLSAFYLDRAKPVHQRVLYRSYHELANPATNADATARPKMYIHIGPHKTASTSTQTELTKYQDRLAQDGILYLGRYYHPYISPIEHRLILNRFDDSAIQTAARDMFRNCWHSDICECVQDLHQLLLNKLDRRPYQALPHLLISDEAFLKLFDDFDVDADADSNSTTATTTSPEQHINRHYELLQEVLGQDWDVVVVLAYRRYYEWLPSNKHQIDKTRTFQSNWNSTRLEPLFPIARANDTAKSLEARTTAMLEYWSRQHFYSEATYNTLRKLAAKYTNFSFKIYHLYSHLSVRTNFLCNVLENAHYSCLASRKQDAVATEERINTREEASESNIFVSYPSAFFDAMAVAALPLIRAAGTGWERPVVAQTLRKQYYSGTTQWWEQQNPELLEEEEDDDDDGLEGDDDGSIDTSTQDDDDGDDEWTDPPLPEPVPNPWDIPLLCPTERQIQQLLLFSLELESRYLPKLFRKSSADHRAGFYGTDKIAFCWVDVDAWMANRTAWKDFMVQTFAVAPPPPPADIETE